MNEASSKYVDQIAVEKLITEKLALVHHSPVFTSNLRSGFADFGSVPVLPHDLVEAGWLENGDGRNLNKREAVQEKRLRFTSFIHTPFSENNTVQVRVAQTTDRPPEGIVIFVHGLWEDNRDIYQFLISQLVRSGIDVYSLCLPYHYERRPAASLFSGEYFWSADLQRSSEAYQQAVYDLYQLYNWLKIQAPLSGNFTPRPVWIAGFSMGGGIALSLAALADLDGVFAINPVCNLSELVWNSRLFGPIRLDLDAAGVGFSELKQIYAPFEPTSIAHIRTERKRIILARSIYDQINHQENYDLLCSRWQPGESIAYKAGHLNILRVPRLAADIARYALNHPVEAPATESGAADLE